MTVNCIVQARMGSTRLPGKVMMEVNGKPLVGYLIDRLEKCHNIDKLVFAIPERDLDSPLGRFLTFRRINISTGPEDDVAKRFAIALKNYPCDVFVRVCADSPLISPFIVDEAATDYFDIYYCVGALGGQAETFDTKIFLTAAPFMKGDEREHLGLYFQRKFGRIVDTPEDFESVQCMLVKEQLWAHGAGWGRNMSRPMGRVGWRW